MQVVKRNGTKQPVLFDKVTSRIAKLCYGMDPAYIDPVLVAQKAVSGIFDGVQTSQLDELASETAAAMVTLHPDYSVLAARIAVSNLHKQTEKKFSTLAVRLNNYVHAGRASPLVSDAVVAVVQKHGPRIDSAILHDRDFEYDYFGFKTLERSYLLREDGRVAERPQHMLMRVAIGIHGEDIERVLETYDLMSQRFFTHATPTMFNAGTPQPQMSSCFLLTTKEDSIDGIFETAKRCAAVSKFSGGIGLAVSTVRAEGSYIRSSGGRSNGLVPMLRVFDATARYVDQGGGKRKGGVAIYLEPWHADVFAFLDLKKNHGKEEARARDLFYALWIPDLFMRRVEEEGEWSLFCPSDCPLLADTHSAAFEEAYETYVAEGKARRTIPAKDLWFAILDSQIETGTPYMLFKDSANRKSNHKHLGTIRSSNLCTEVVQFTSPDEVAVCNLASVSLPAFLLPSGPAGSNEASSGFDFEALARVVRVVTRNLNRVIDGNFYPLAEARASNLRHRPIGIGVQGFADALLKLRLPFDSEEAARLNKDIFETIAFASLSESAQLAEQFGTYDSYEASPVSKGILQQDMWDEEGHVSRLGESGLWDWDALRATIRRCGVRNSLLVAPMPTASTAHILGNCEAFEPYTANVFSRRVLAGEFPVVNKHLILKLVEDGVWDAQMRNDILRANGSVQGVPRLSVEVQNLFKTAWEIKQRVLIDMAAERGRYVCQSQSLNVFLAEPSYSKMTSLHFYAFRRGLKTGMYYLRTRAAADAIKFTVSDASTAQRSSGAKLVCNKDEACLACGA